MKTFRNWEEFNRAQREIDNLNQLRSHPNVVQLFEYFSEMQPGCILLFLVVEWTNNDLMTEMQQRYEQHFPWTEEALVQIATDLIQVLATAERLGICHRNINPHNVYWDSVTSRVKLGDFELSAGGIVSGIAQQASVVGTLAFMPKELRDATVLDELRISHNVVKSDVFSLGITMLTLANLEAPSSLIANVTVDALWSAISAISYSDRVKYLIWDMTYPDVQQRLSFVQLEEKYCVSVALPEIQERGDSVMGHHADRSDNNEPTVTPTGQGDALSPLSEQQQFQSVCSNCGKFMGKDGDYPELPCAQCGTLYFCGVICLQQYVEKVTLCYSVEGVCDKCSGTIQQSDIIEACGGDRLFKSQQQDYFTQSTDRIDFLTIPSFFPAFLPFPLSRNFCRAVV